MPRTMMSMASGRSSVNFVVAALGQEATAPSAAGRRPPTKRAAPAAGKQAARAISMRQRSTTAPSTPLTIQNWLRSTVQAGLLRAGRRRAATLLSFLRFSSSSLSVASTLLAARFCGARVAARRARLGAWRRWASRSSACFSPRQDRIDEARQATPPTQTATSRKIAIRMHGVVRIMRVGYSAASSASASSLSRP